MKHICDTCRHYDGGRCLKFDIAVYWGHEAPCWEAPAQAPIQQIPMGGYVPYGNAMALKCACGSLFVSNNVCQTCGKRVTG